LRSCEGGRAGERNKRSQQEAPSESHGFSFLRHVQGSLPENRRSAGPFDTRRLLGSLTSLDFCPERLRSVRNQALDSQEVEAVRCA
jgi:hypothetical protein